MSFMEMAISEAQKAAGEIPVGAVLVKDGKIIASAHNTREKDNDITAHAEVLVLRAGAKVFDNWRLDGCELYVTLEPCPMCAWAILQARVKSVYFGSYDVNYGALGSKMDLRKIPAGQKLNVYGGILENECDKLLDNFFKNLRGN